MTPFERTLLEDLEMITTLEELKAKLATYNADKKYDALITNTTTHIATCKTNLEDKLT